MDCELCTREATKYDNDLCMALCIVCYGEYNGSIVEIELDEVY